MYLSIDILLYNINYLLDFTHNTHNSAKIILNLLFIFI